ncbi:hypothetical protein [Notoacmeibacter sp. MSK16QG-6]|uniref:hypothetical protein n=1 Tax=Notoacmeibacter sp. MSK16QG-6 TaxID=2957982 RepID=UPI00209E21A4|nr:hypothetical protein [Notoacmeibacter sp. MSK16QG-6]MCP1201092.1 hypothetical protein [Notoacmeibacter sp. MSK16QG-6]
MPDFTSLGSTVLTETAVSLLVATTIAFALLLPSVRLWWIHSLPAALLISLEIWRFPERSLAIEALAAANVVYVILCRQIRADVLVLRYGILWFSLFGFIATFVFAASLLPGNSKSAGGRPPAPAASHFQYADQRMPK